MYYTLITGASSGIGEEFARQLAAQKHHLILIARSGDKLQTLANELKQLHHVEVKTFAIDLAESNSADKLFEFCQRENLEVNFLINDAGIGLIGKFDAFPWERIEEMIHLNILTLTKIVYVFLPILRKNGGTIINLASQIAFSASPYLAVYAATKAYVLNFTEGIREEYEKEGLKIMALCPGPTVTNFFQRADASTQDMNVKFRPTKDVVDEALSALDKNKAYTVVGWENKLMVFILRLMPRTLATKLAAYQIKQRAKKE
jgi:uncharacterized protein